MNTYTSPASSKTAPMPPTSDPLKLFMEDIEKTQTLSGKYVKIQAYINSLKEERSKIKDLDLPISKQFLDHAIKTLDVELDSVSENIKNMLNQTGITDVDVLPEEMIRGFLNLSPKPTNTVQQAPQISMQSQQGSLHQGLLPQGLGQEGLLPQDSLQTKMQRQARQGLLRVQLMQQQQRLLQPLQQQGLLQHQQLLMQQQKLLQQQQQGLLQPQIMKPSPLQQQQGLLTPQMMQLLQQQALLQQQGLLQPQIMKPSQLQQQQGLLEQLGKKVFGQQG